MKGLIKEIILISIILISTCSSCTIEKRRYRSGYHLQRSKSVKVPKPNKAKSQESNNKLVHLLIDENPFDVYTHDYSNNSDDKRKSNHILASIDAIKDVSFHQVSFTSGLRKKNPTQLQVVKNFHDSYLSHHPKKIKNINYRDDSDSNNNTVIYTVMGIISSVALSFGGSPVALVIGLTIIAIICIIYYSNKTTSKSSYRGHKKRRTIPSGH